MVSIGARHNTCHLFTAEVATERERRIVYRFPGSLPVGCRQRCGHIVHPFQLHARLERKRSGCKERVDKVGAVGQQPFDDVKVHFVAVPADRMIAVYVSVAVYEVIHVAVVPLAVRKDILKIKLSGFGEQRVKLFRYILLCSEVVQMQPSLKKKTAF